MEEQQRKVLAHHGNGAGLYASKNLIFATDVQYAENNALAAGLFFPDWESDKIDQQILKTIDQIAPYEPGAFYKRELPCILSLLEDVDRSLEAIVIDGFVTLGDDKKDGLGMHLYNNIQQTIPIIGVAKKAFVGTPENCQIFRGKSNNPLYITSVGIPLSEAKKLITQMHGENRIPTLLNKVDQLCRGINAT